MTARCAHCSPFPFPGGMFTCHMSRRFYLTSAHSTSPTPSSPITPTSGMDTSMTLPPPDVSSTSQPSTSTSFSSAITIPASNPSTSSSTPTKPQPPQPQPTLPPVNIYSSASSSEPKSVTTTILSTSGIEIVTMTSVVENPAAILNHANDDNSNSNSCVRNLQFWEQHLTT
jgi:hypothetical protein